MAESWQIAHSRGLGQLQFNASLQLAAGADVALMMVSSCCLTNPCPAASVACVLFVVQGVVERLEYDPNRTGYIALVRYPPGEANAPAGAAAQVLVWCVFVFLVRYLCLVLFS